METQHLTVTFRDSDRLGASARFECNGVPQVLRSEHGQDELTFWLGTDCGSAVIDMRLIKEWSYSLTFVTPSQVEIDKAEILRRLGEKLRDGRPIQSDPTKVGFERIAAIKMVREYYGRDHEMYPLPKSKGFVDFHWPRVLDYSDIPF